MSAESFKRKLTAILSADVKGYSRLMGENEVETVKTLTAYHKIMAELIQQHRGRVIDSPGDNILAEFGSVVDAVQCAVSAQNEFKARNTELPENRRMLFRIGINLGDVIEEEERIYGDGVYIAARLEALADAGGICISNLRIQGATGIFDKYGACSFPLLRILKHFLKLVWLLCTMSRNTSRSQRRVAADPLAEALQRGQVTQTCQPLDD